MSNDAFIQASRRQLRFASRQGPITTEDLWTLQLKDLDTIGQKVMAEIQPGTTSLLENPDPKINSARQDNELRLEIIKTVIAIKQDENKAAFVAAGNRRRKELLTQILETKKIEEIGGKSIAELEAEIAALG